jgi:hypothetical protein
MTTTVFVFTLNGGKGKWSRYTFPFAIEAFAQLGQDLYIRHGDAVSKVSEDAESDEVDGVAVDIAGSVQWPYLDNGQPGADKTVEGLDIVATGSPKVAIGFDQTNLLSFTTPYEVPADTLPGGYIPMPVTAPTLSVRLTFDSAAWSINAVQLYLKDNTLGS